MGPPFPRRRYSDEFRLYPVPQVLQDHRGVSKPKPNIAHLRVYGCRAYPLIHKIPKKQKLRPRAQIGYLVGCDSSNIFRIWVPQDKKIIVTKDVTFDELRKYDPNDLRPAYKNVSNLELARGWKQRMKSLTLVQPILTNLPQSR